MTGERLPEILATTIERKDGLPCGACDGRHVETLQDWRACKQPCICPCCNRAFGASFAAEHPDPITIRGGVRVITEAAIEESIRRLEAEIASLEKDGA